MSGGQLDTVLRHLRKLVGSPAAEDSDGRLLDRFLAQRDEAAFAALLARHGPMVWSVCRRLLPQSHDAEDAFQATFLVLVRRARSLDRRGSLAGWLHAVAGRVALRARSSHARERPLTEEVPAMNPTDPTAAAARQELRTLIDEELRRLPEKYRGPVLLCDVQGRTHEDAARQLGYPPGSMSWRLARGRELLRHGLERRGVTLPAALLAALLAEEATAAVPAALAEATARAALLMAAGTAGALAPSVAALVDGTTRALTVARLKLVAVLLALGLLVAGAGVATQRALTAGRPAPASPGEQAENDEPAPPAPPVEKPAPRMDAPGDPLPPGAVARLGTLSLRPMDAITAFTFSADGKLLAIGGGLNDEWLQIWTVDTGKFVRRLPESGVTALAFSPNGKILAVAARSAAAASPMIRFWDLELDKELCHSDKLDSYPSALAFAPDSKKLFARDENRFSVWDVEDAMEMREHKQQDAGANGFVLSPDRKWSESISFKGQNGGANGFVLSPDGKTLAAITEEGKRVIVLGNDLGERFLFGQPSSPFTFTAVAFSPDGKLLAAGTSVGSVFLREAASGKELPAVEQPGKADIVQLAFTADGKELLALDRLQRMRAWEAATEYGLKRDFAMPGDFLLAAVFSPDRKLLALADRRDFHDQHVLRILDLATGKDHLRLVGHDSGVCSVAFSPDSKALASTSRDGVTVLWDLATLRERWRVESKNDYGGAAAFSSSGKLLGAPGTSGRVELFDLDTGKSRQTFGPASEYCRSLALTPDGQSLAIVGNGLRLSFWNPDGLSQGATDINATQVAVDELGRFAAAVPGGGWLRDPARPLEPRLLSITDVRDPTCVALARDGTTLAVGSEGDGMIFLFDPATGRERARLAHKKERLRSVALSRNGQVVAAGDSRGTVRLYHAKTGKKLISLAGHVGPVLSLAFSPDGQRLASGSGDTTVLLWDLTRVWQVEFEVSGGEALASLWDDLASPDDLLVHRATVFLVDKPAQSVAFIKERVKLVTSDQEERLRRAIADLKDEDFKVRERALEELRRFGSEAVPLLRELQRTATDPRLQARLRAFLTIAELEGVTPSPPEFSRPVRAVAVLETIGTPEAHEMLEDLAKGAPSARLTEAAQAALERWPR
jgi:RNA polymerase sigma factor (sigma-70 family)